MYMKTGLRTDKSPLHVSFQYLHTHLLRFKIHDNINAVVKEDCTFFFCTFQNGHTHHFKYSLQERI
jgi:hypothetical protein